MSFLELGQFRTSAPVSSRTMHLNENSPLGMALKIVFKSSRGKSFMSQIQRIMSIIFQTTGITQLFKLKTCPKDKQVSDEN